MVLIGGPGTGKSSVLNELLNRDYVCYPEIAREITNNAQDQGIDQLFLEDPLLFSTLLLEGREQQYLDAHKHPESLVFFDRGIPDIHAYLDFTNVKYPAIFLEKSRQYRYTDIFLFNPWKEIYLTDTERYESFEESQKINEHLIKSYQGLGYVIKEVPFGSIQDRAQFIVNSLSQSE